MRSKTSWRIKRISILALYLAIIVITKYKFGINVDGFELVTAFFVLAGILFNILDCFLLLICFNIICLMIYGFFVGWIAYWYIFAFDFLLVKLFFQKIKVRSIYLAGVGFICGQLLSVWYFFPDLFLLGANVAKVKFITALPINFIEGISNFIFLLLVSDIIFYLFKNYNLIYRASPIYKEHQRG